MIGQITKTEYRKDGQVEAVIYPNNIETIYRYDGLNRRRLVVQNYLAQGISDPADWVWGDLNGDGDFAWRIAINGSKINHSTAQDTNIIVQVTHDAAGRMTSLRDPNGNLTEYAYDRRDRRIGLTNALALTWETCFVDACGSTRTTLTYPGLSDQRPYEVTRTTDRLGRLTEIHYGDHTATPHVTFGYDLAGNRVTMKEYNRTQAIRASAYGYDEARRLRSVVTPEGTVSYGYDVRGLRNRLTINDTQTITYQHDARGRLIALTDWDDQTTGFSYDGVDRHTLTERANGFDTRYTYDLGGRLTEILHQDTSGTPTELARFAYTLNALGHRTQAIETLGGSQRTLNYAYDGLSRLTGVSGDQMYAYGYDLAGNLTNHNGVTRAYNALNQIAGFTYDPNGNLTSDGVSYRYDGLGQRIGQGALRLAPE